MAKQRDHSMDFFKLLLVFGMILAHTLQLVVHTDNKVLLSFSRYINLITFSGFLFSFGYVNQLAYLSKTRAEIRMRLLRNFLLTLAVYYLSGAALWAFPTLAAGEPLQLRSLLRILAFVRIQGYSEFLLSFAMLNVFVYCFFGGIKQAVQKDWVFALVLAVCALSTCIDYGRVKINLLGVFIGTREFNVFPILQYFPYYLIGARMAARPRGKAFLLGGICGTGAFFLYTALREVPSRFPPSFLWIAGSGLFIALYNLLSQWVAGVYPRLPASLARLITFTGRNTLYFLLFSNLLLFAWWAFAPPIEGGWRGLGAGLCCVLLSGLLVWTKDILWGAWTKRKKA